MTSPPTFSLVSAVAPMPPFPTSTASNTEGLELGEGSVPDQRVTAQLVATCVTMWPLFVALHLLGTQQTELTTELGRSIQTQSVQNESTVAYISIDISMAICQ